MFVEGVGLQLWGEPMEPEPAAMEPEPAATAEVAPSQEHDVVIEEGEHTMYPAALASHETVLEDKQLFLSLLQDLCTKLQDAEPKKFRPNKFRIPTGALPMLSAAWGQCATPRLTMPCWA